MTSDSRISGAVFGFTAASILALATLCARAVSFGASETWRLPFRLLCHGIEDRCLLAWGVAMPICSRCFGIYAGMLAALLLFAAAGALRNRRLPTMLLVLLVAPLALDGLSQAAGLRESTNALRLITGFLAGGSFMMWVMTRIEAHAGERAARSGAALQR